MKTFRLVDADTQEILNNNITSDQIYIAKMKEFWPNANNINFTNGNTRIRFNQQTLGWIEENE